MSHGVASRYGLITSKMTWLKAVDACANQGGILAELTTDAERVGVVSQLRNIPGINNDILVGLRQLPGSSEPAGGWFWRVSGVPLAINQWNSGEPNNHADKEHVAQLYLNAGKFYDFADGIVKGWPLCECHMIQ